MDLKVLGAFLILARHTPSDTVMFTLKMSSLVQASDFGAQGTVGAKSMEKLPVRIEHKYHVICHAPDGSVRWEDGFHNLTTTAGLNKYLDSTLKTGYASPAWYVGLITGPGAGNTYALSDVMGSHAGWTESAAYSNVTRPAWTPGSVAAGSVDNSGSVAVFNINAGATIAGCFLTDSNTKSGVTGILLGEGNFTIADRLVQSGDTLSVTMTATMTSS